jgi:hypothetical protein
MAYADHLTEQGDLRGEFIQVQLALEDPATPRAEYNRLHQRQTELLRDHERTWLGKLGPYLNEECWQRSFARGWLDWLSFAYLPIDLARDLAAEPATRLVRKLQINNPITAENYYLFGLEGFNYEEEGATDALELLAASPYLSNVRVFHLGSTEGFTENNSDAYMYNSRYELSTADQTTWDLIEKMARLEELHLFTSTSRLRKLFASKKLSHLRVLQVYLSDDYPLDVLVANTSLGRLTHLSLHPRNLYEDEGETDSFLPLHKVRAVLESPNLPSLTHLRLHQSDLGDEGCSAIVRSGILERLKFLDLARGRITDAGARTLADSPELRRLDVLDVSCNALTRVGVEALQETGITVRATEQHGPRDEFYLFEGEME